MKRPVYAPTYEVTEIQRRNYSKEWKWRHCRSIVPQNLHEFKPSCSSLGLGTKHCYKFLQNWQVHLIRGHVQVEGGIFAISFLNSKWRSLIACKTPLLLISITSKFSTPPSITSSLF